MQTHHSTFGIANQTVHQIDFLRETFTESDLLWLPHHHKLTQAGKKRKTEHLAGRIAAFYALRERGIQHIPDIGENRQPLWPDGWYGSITHSGATALAVVSRQPVGIDLEAIFSVSLCNEVADSIATPAEQALLQTCSLPFPLALTLSFSARESLFKALSGGADVSSACVTALNARSITLQWSGRRYPLNWQQQGNQVITLLTKTFEPA